MDSKDSGSSSLQARTSNSNNISNSSSSGDEEAAPPRTKSELQEEIQKTVYGQYKVHCCLHACFFGTCTDNKLLPPYNTQWCFAAVAVSVPISVKLRSYWPLAILGSIGSIADYTEGYLAAWPMKKQMIELRDKQRQQEWRERLALSNGTSDISSGSGSGSSRGRGRQIQGGELGGDGSEGDVIDWEEASASNDLAHSEPISYKD